MKSSPTEHLILDFPIPYANLVINLRFVGCSNQWLKQFNLTKDNILGHTLMDIVSYLPRQLLSVVQELENHNVELKKQNKILRSHSSFQNGEERPQNC